MPVEKKLPPVRLVVSKDYFNKLVELTSHIDYLLEEVNSKTSLYDKLMKYTFLEDDEQVELRFFAGEASEVILLLLCNLKDGEISKDYYEELIQTRKKYKEEKNANASMVFVGRLVSDPEVKTLEDGKSVSNITLAIPRSYKNENGEYETDFIDCTLWKGVAENTAEYCRKGDVIGVKGRLQSSTYEDKETGNTRKRMDVVAEKVTFLSSKSRDSQERE